MGGQFWLSFDAETRRATGRGAGDEVEVRLELDDAPRTVDVPHDLAAALVDDPAAAAAWEKLAYSHKKAHVTAIESAKAAGTRARRVASTLAKLRG